MEKVSKDLLATTQRCYAVNVVGDHPHSSLYYLLDYEVFEDKRKDNAADPMCLYLYSQTVTFRGHLICNVMVFMLISFLTWHVGILCRTQVVFYCSA